MEGINHEKKFQLFGQLGRIIDYQLHKDANIKDSKKDGLMTFCRGATNVECSQEMELNGDGSSLTPTVTVYH